MAKKKEDNDIYKEIREDVDGIIDMSNDEDDYKEKIKDQYEKRKENIKEYAHKAKDKIQDKPFESVLIATGIGTLVGLTMAASAIGMSNMYKPDSYKRKFSRAKKEVRSWPDSFEDEVKDKPIQALGIAVGVGILLGAIMGKKDGNK